MFEQKNGALCFSRRGERVCVQAVGRDGLRVRATMFPRFDGADWALAGALPHDADIGIGEGGATVRNGRIRCEITGVRLFLEQPRRRQGGLRQKRHRMGGGERKTAGLLYHR